MTAYIVTYDWNSEGNDKDRAKVRAKIKECGKWAKVTESSFVVISTMTATAIRDHCRAAADKNDYLFVFEIGKSYSGFGSSDVIDWLAANL